MARGAASRPTPQPKEPRHEALRRDRRPDCHRAAGTVLTYRALKARRVTIWPQHQTAAATDSRNQLLAPEPGLAEILARSTRPYAPGEFADALPYQTVEQLHEWLAGGDWGDPSDVLETLRWQAPALALADLLRDLAIDLDGVDAQDPARQLRDAEQLLRTASALICEVDHDTPGHGVDCPGGCHGTGEIMVTLTWEDQDGVDVPVHQEPADCRRGEPEPQHATTCQCGGSGTFLEGGFLHRCLRNSRVPVGDEPPF